MKQQDTDAENAIKKQHNDTTNQHNTDTIKWYSETQHNTLKADSDYSQDFKNDIKAS